MASFDAKYKGEIYRYDQPLVIATNRNTAVILPTRIRYQSGGYPAGTILALNNDGLYQAYTNGAASGIGVAKAILLEAHPVEDFPGTGSTDSTLATALFGGCTVYQDKLTGYHANSVTDLKGTLITLPDSQVLLKF